MLAMSRTIAPTSVGPTTKRPLPAYARSRPGEVTRLLGEPIDLLEALGRAVGRGLERPLRQRRVPDDAGEQVVEIVGHSARQDAEALELLRVQQPALELALLLLGLDARGDVDDVAEEVRRPAVLGPYDPRRVVQPADGAVLAGDAVRLMDERLDVAAARPRDLATDPLEIFRGDQLRVDDAPAQEVVGRVTEHLDCVGRHVLHRPAGLVPPAEQHDRSSDEDVAFIDLPTPRGEHTGEEPR
jgi:hypothetical protein